MGLFDDKVSYDTKRLMLNALKTQGTKHPLKRITLDPALVASKNLNNFVSKSTLRFFTITGLPSTFLNKNLQLWSVDEGLPVCPSLYWQHAFEHDEKQKQSLLLVVKDTFLQTFDFLCFRD